MEKVMVSVFVSVMLGLVLLFLGLVLGISAFNGREKSSPFECGFDPIGSSRVPFSLRFFLLAVIFVVFDVEIVLLFPAVMGIGGDWMLFVGYSVLVLFLVILFLGVVHEWREGSLEWES
uniref:NADH-ubiquinone oxidoreductase chain 3 n=1 Tax=Margaritifera margaritifera TaxID=2505931 RepID=A0A455ZC08_9BIVA|nr:NADH dehydrogenase subunit 3 [Margaritifera margaritifera]QCX42016.1 NADH dehydrogenase subunit 3 [Margaritifera margaritifera]QCX42029.1 NADH dehydrogenase subunit 3 [Margaritifera margaritifera]QCX42042.1 NADH dehydrogenase subunit 3 [Margaritifera margaritifera]QRW36434.1 NADH dehydrogenase subunit 3 [Margaritifera margaritifera]DAC74116.1 TPA_inf: NADH dehydrogenase subunit 3 [Margaritifera margaritifera]